MKSVPNSPDSDRVLHGNHWLIQLIAGLPAAASLFFAFLSFSSEQLFPGVILLVFALLGMVSFLIYGHTEMDDQKVAHLLSQGYLP